MCDDALRVFEAEDTSQDCKACVEAKKVCGRWASIRWSDDKDFRILARGHVSLVS
jgi:hypothetical protein